MRSLSFQNWTLIVFISLFCISAVIGVLAFYQNNKMRNALTEAIAQRAADNAQIILQTNKNMSAAKAISELGEENRLLLDLFNHLKEPQKEIQYIVKTETILQAVAPTETFKDLPDYYGFKLKPDLLVADFYKQKDNFVFNTYDLSYKTTLVIGEKNTSAILQVSSSANDIWHDVPSTIEVINVQNNYPRIKPNLHIGLSSSTNYLMPQPTVSIPFIEITDDLNILAPGFTVGDKPYINLWLTNYNISKHAPVLSDLWVGGGLTLDFGIQTGIFMSLTTSL